MSKNISLPRKSSGARRASITNDEPYIAAGVIKSNPRSLLKKKFEKKQIQDLTKISENDLNNVFEVFENDDSEINKEKFQAAMVDSGHAIYEDSAVVDALWNALDANHDHSIDQKELLIGLAALAGGNLEEKLRFTFKVFDLNNDQAIQREELVLMISHLAKVKYTKNEDLDSFVNDFVNKTFEKYDENNDNQLSFEEFQQASQENSEVKDFFLLALEGLQ
eukprot:TRINITY_DN11233_c0_g1_i1.p1 TRINITY_DN11233_c0_g1~~TRINITY_DN11233_c0_g1_i1.p1  ORF type:complete len:238 (-),score=89.45 TRINITY_DN11233_c0_g1_i1:10-672(-)